MNNKVTGRGDKNAMFAFLRHLLNVCRKFKFWISQGSVATCLKWGWYCHMGLVANFICFQAVQKFWKLVKIWQSYREFKDENFFDTQCSIIPYSSDCGNNWYVTIPIRFTAIVDIPITEYISLISLINNYTVVKIYLALFVVHASRTTPTKRNNSHYGMGHS